MISAFNDDSTVHSGRVSYCPSVASLASSASLLPGMVEPGVTYKYYRGVFDKVVDFANIQPTKQGKLMDVHIDSFTELKYFMDETDIEAPGNYGIVFKGKIQVPLTGNWTFYLGSNDGSILFLGNRKVIDNDGCHFYAEKACKVNLSTGPQSFTLYFFHKNGKMLEMVRQGAFLMFGWQFNDRMDTEFSIKQPIPKRHLLNTGDLNLATTKGNTRVTIEINEYRSREIHHKMQIHLLESRLKEQNDQMNQLLKHFDLGSVDLTDSIEENDSKIANFNRKIESLKQNYFASLSLALKMQGLWNGDSIAEEYEKYTKVSFEVLLI